MWRSGTWLGLALLGLICGCGHPRVNLETGPRHYEPHDYTSVLRKWTRDSKLITLTEMDNVLTVTSTYESWDFRWAYVARYADDYRLTPAQTETHLQRSLAEARETEQFYVALYAQNAKYGNLQLEDPAWVVRLVDDSGAETPPLEITPITRPSAVERTYFPYTSPWRLAYRITFPRQRDGGQRSVREGALWFGLRFAGPQGRTTLIWEVDRG